MADVCLGLHLEHRAATAGDLRQPHAAYRRAEIVVQRGPSSCSSRAEIATLDTDIPACWHCPTISHLKRAVYHQRRPLASTLTTSGATVPTRSTTIGVHVQIGGNHPQPAKIGTRYGQDRKLTFKSVVLSFPTVQMQELAERPTRVSRSGTPRSRLVRSLAYAKGASSSERLGRYAVSLSGRGGCRMPSLRAMRVSP